MVRILIRKPISIHSSSFDTTNHLKSPFITDHNPLTIHKSFIEEKKMKNFNFGMAIAMGIAIGTSTGVAMNDIAAGLSMGVGIGIAMGFSMRKLKANQQKDDHCKI